MGHSAAEPCRQVGLADGVDSEYHAFPAAEDVLELGMVPRRSRVASAWPIKSFLARRATARCVIVRDRGGRSDTRVGSKVELPSNRNGRARPLLLRNACKMPRALPDSGFVPSLVRRDLCIQGET